MADAGKYRLLDLFWDERTNPINETVAVFKRHVQGDILDLDEAEATRLVDADAVEPEDAPRLREVSAARDRFLASLAALPDDLRSRVLGDKSTDEVLDELEGRETPVEELHVHHPDAVGFTNAGHPKYAAAAHGEGGVGEGLDEADGPTATTEELDATQSSLDDGTKTSTNARGGAAARRDRDAQVKRADTSGTEK
jgi:hypothetical protein